MHTCNFNMHIKTIRQMFFYIFNNGSTWHWRQTHQEHYQGFGRSIRVIPTFCSKNYYCKVKPIQELSPIKQSHHGRLSGHVCYFLH